ncbi:cupredoxin domain-containing protein [Salipaludibacillus daqingensis]|uniref:cupredoxin domain-containing protein n=1 Tax=Salipaludibacillus daqingensis TaxID=3041001 RepID=UPI00247452EA|nr:cupredoxin domain-containing protein [Salipaludibacillus daqingensis]
MNFITLKGKWIIIALISFFIVVTFLFLNSFTQVTGGIFSSEDDEPYHINMITTEFKSETESGEKIESYRWDPGTVHLSKGKPIKLSIYGVNGKEHPFIIEGTDVTGTVKKGEETILNLQFNKSGTYRLICTAHETIDDNGPMIAYLVVD